MAAILLSLALVAAACGGDGGGEDGSSGDDRPSVVVTTSILGDVVANLVGDQARVVTIMGPGVDPHAFSASAQQANALRRADLVVLNGGGFEAGLRDLVSAAANDGVPTYEAISAVSTLPLATHGHDHEHDHGHDDGDQGSDQDAVDPHFFADPVRMAEAARGIATELASTVEGLDAAVLERSTAAYVDQLRQLDAEVSSTLAVVPAPSRVLVTNHEVFRYFADRYSFEVVGSVIPSGTTNEAASSAALAELADAARAAGTRAIFVDSSSSDELARTVADEMGHVEVVPLFTESLGEPGSGGERYVDMVRTNASRIAQALG